MSAGLKIIRKRITSVKNTQKITRAMKMVAAAKLRRASERINEMRAYAEHTEEILASVAARAEQDLEGFATHPLFAPRPIETVLLFAFSSDRGLAGGFNASVQKKTFSVWQELEADGKKVVFAVVGRKVKDFLQRRNADILYDFGDVLRDGDDSQQSNAIGALFEDYQSKKFDACYLIYNVFRSAISQEIVNVPLLPVRVADLPAEDVAKEMIFEPSPSQLLDVLGPMYMQCQIIRAFLDSTASEHGARMSAMDAATTNASQIIDKLTLQFNRARQAAITKELMEIIGGSEALQ